MRRVSLRLRLGLRPMGTNNRAFKPLPGRPTSSSDRRCDPMPFAGAKRCSSQPARKSREQVNVYGSVLQFTLGERLWGTWCVTYSRAMPDAVPESLCAIVTLYPVRHLLGNGGYPWFGTEVQDCF